MSNQFPGNVFQDQMSNSIEDFSGPSSRKRRFIDYSSTARSKSFYGNNDRPSSRNLQEMLALVKDGNNNNTHDAGVFEDEDDEDDEDDDIEDGILQIKEESSSEENDDLDGCATDGDSSASITAPVVESFYSNGDGKKDGDVSEVNDSAIHDMTGESGHHDETEMQASPRGDSGALPNGKPETCSVSQSKEVIAEDLSSHHDPDLAISPPQSYTAQVQDAIQVRNTIRQQLLAKKPKTTHDGSESMKSPPPRSSMIFDRIRIPTDLSGMKFQSPIQTWPVKQENGNISDARLPHHSTPIFGSFLTEQSKNLLESLRNPAHNNIQDIIRLKNLNMAALGSQDDAPKCSYSSQPIYPFREMTSDSMKSEPPSSDPTGQNGVEQKVYKCNFCQKTFLFKSKYHEHLPVHTSARPFECHLCLRTYKYKYDLRVHLRTHLGIPTKSTICPFCSNKFLTNKLLRQHIREAHEEQQRISDEQCAQSLENINSAA